MPKLIHSHLNYFGDAEYGFSGAISTIKRIRKELDPYFVPVFRRQVFQWDDGSVKVFKNFGFGRGLSGLVNVKPDYDVLDAVKPCGNGYIAKLERIGRIDLWLPVDGNKDGTPGKTEPPDVWWFYFIKESLDYQARLVAEAREKAAVSNAYAAQKEQAARDSDARKKLAETVTSEAAKDFAPDKRKINQHIRDLTSSEFAEFQAEQQGLVPKAKKPFVHLGT